EEAGIKSATLIARGENAYGLFSAEKGVHRLVRISPFDAAARRHTSFALVEVSPLVDEVEEVEIDEGDLQIDTYRASGAGAQHVNKTDSAVRITHRPTGIVVQIQNERSQSANKATAMATLRSKLLELEEQKRREELAREKGEAQDVGWGSQIRSYVLHPYTMVKDHRTGFEMGDAQRARAVFEAVDGELRWEPRVTEGEWREGGPVAEIWGSAASILKGERVALNFLGRLSGIATLTARFVRAVEGTGTQILDTRKTTPGLRALEKQAVKEGGGVNHRFGLFDAVLIKENHIAAAGGVPAAVERARAAA